MHVDQARRHDPARDVDHLGSWVRGNAGAYSGNLAPCEADVGHRVEMLRRIDDPPAFQNEIDGHGSSRRGRMVLRCLK